MPWNPVPAVDPGNPVETFINPVGPGHYLIIGNRRIKQLGGASRIQGEVSKPDSYLFSVKSPANTTNVSRVYLPWQPQEVKVTSADGKALLGTYEWDEKSHTCQLKFENDPQGVIVELK